MPEADKLSETVTKVLLFTPKLRISPLHGKQSVYLS